MAQIELGAVDGALPPGARSGLVELFREGLGPIGQHFLPARLEITASGDSYTAVLDARPPAGQEGTTTPSAFSGLWDKAA